MADNQGSVSSPGSFGKMDINTSLDFTMAPKLIPQEIALPDLELKIENKNYWHNRTLSATLSSDGLGWTIYECVDGLFTSILVVGSHQVYGENLNDKILESDAEDRPTYGEFFKTNEYGERLIQLVRDVGGPQKAADSLGIEFITWYKYITLPEPVAEEPSEPETISVDTGSSLLPFLAAAGLLGAGFIYGRGHRKTKTAIVAKPIQVEA